MSSELRELYQELILDHSKKPRNCRRQEAATCCANGHNPLCGDKLTLYLKLEGDRIQDISFEGSGCAISTASASIMTEIMRGKSRGEAEHAFELFHALLTEEGEQPELEEGMEKLAAFANVREFPVRVKCATLAWHTLKAALDRSSNAVSTE